MEYGALVREAWSLTWRYRFLWFFGLFAGGSCTGPGGGGNWQVPGGEDGAPELGQAGEEVGRWLAANVGLVVTVAIVAALIGLAFLVLSFVAQGAMARSTAELAAGAPWSFGQAFAVGRRYFWRYLGLTLLLLLFVIAFAIVIGIFIALVVAAEPTGAAIALLVLLVGLPLLLGLIAAAIAGSVIVSYAQRAIALEDVGPWAALRRGWGLFRRNLGTSLVLWLLGLVLGIVAGVAVAVVLIVAVVVLGGIGFALWAVDGFGPMTIVYGVLAVLLFLAALFLVSAITGTFMWHYWTLAYLRLTGRAPATAG